jgi:hypothetical protein
MLVKPSLLGGGVYVPSFMPNDDPCGFGGESGLYGVDVRTGTAYHEPIFLNSEEQQAVAVETKEGEDAIRSLHRITLGVGKSSALGMHIGEEEGVSGYLQQSTGAIIKQTIDPIMDFGSDLELWDDSGYWTHGPYYSP